MHRFPTLRSLRDEHNGTRCTMANRYGEAALMAAGRDFSANSNPIARWDSAMERLYPTSPTARRKTKRLARVGHSSVSAKKDW